MKKLKSLIAFWFVVEFFDHSFGVKDNYFRILKEPPKCDFKKQNMRIKLTIMVKSSAEHFARRTAIRSTFGSENHGLNNFTSQTVFELGLPNNSLTQDLIDKESMVFGDILQADFLDTYRNLTRKTIMGFQWASKNCLNTNFFLVIDDDVLVSLKNLLPTLFSYKKDDLLYMGELVKERKKITEESNKGHLKGKKYTPILYGAAVLYSHRALKNIFRMLPFIKYTWSDYNFIALAAAASNIKAKDNSHFYIKRIPRNLKKFQVLHGFKKPEDLKRCWTLLNSNYSILKGRCHPILKNRSLNIIGNIAMKKPRRRPTIFNDKSEKYKLGFIKSIKKLRRFRRRSLYF